METPSTFGKNLVIHSHLSAGGNIHIGDIIYNVHDDFAQSILFLSITRSGTGHIANLTLKTKHQRLRDQAVGMLQEAIELQIPSSLFRQVDQFQASRRKLEGNRYQNAYGMEPVVLEATLSQLLYEQFFAGDIGEVVRNFLHALEARKITELLLIIASPEEGIRNLPWEMVLDRLVPQQDGVLPLQGFGLVRTMEVDLDGFNMSGKASVPGPLKLLFVTALPEDLPEKSKNLELEDEQKKLIDAVGALEATGDNKPKMVIEFLDVASLDEIKAALQARHHDVVHISGHGQFVADLEQGFLYLETDEGDTAKTEGAALAAVLRGLGHVKLLVLSACETAMAGKGGTAEALATSGIPAVLAMRFSVLDVGAKAFTTAFYTALANGRSITESMAVGRAKLLEQVQTHRGYEPEHPAEWFTPVLYLNQYAAELVDVSRYQFPQDFYTNAQFLKEAHTRLIGSGFIGRKKQRIQMRQAFRDRKAVCLAGLGGMGKTTLAEAFARNYENQSHRMIIWRGENEITELGILNRIVEEFRIWQPASPLLGRLKGIVENAEMPILNRLGYLLRNCLAGEQTILIFDNFEDLLWQEGDADARTIVDDGVREMLNYLLANAPEHCRVMFTSRYRIEGLVGEVFFLDLDKLGLAEQYRLMNFSEVLRGIPAGERERIYARLDGLPRAFTFLEGLVRNDPGFSFRDLEAQLGQVEAEVFADLMLERIYGLLDEGSRKIFLVASVFFTRTPVEALEAVSGNAEIPRSRLLLGLEILFSWSLCYYDAGAGEFEVHGMVREWVAFTGLLDAEERKGVALGAGEYFYNMSSIQSITTAITYFKKAEAWEVFAKASFVLQDNLQKLGLYHAAWELCSEVMVSVDDLKVRGSALGNMGTLLHHFGKYSEALTLLEQSLEIRRMIGDKVLEGLTLNNIGHIYYSQENHEMALHYFEEGLKIQQEIGDRKFQGTTMNNIGGIYLARGENEKAMQIWKESLQFLRDIGNRSGEARTLNNISQIYTAIGDFDTALNYLEQCLEIQKETVDREGEEVTLNNISQIYKSKGENQKALVYLDKCLKINREIGNKTEEADSLNGIGLIFLELGDHKNAIHFFCESLKLMQEINDNTGVARTSELVGMLLHNQKRSEEAVPYLVKAYIINTQLDSPDIDRSSARLSGIVKAIGESRFQEILSTLDLENL